MGLQSVPNSYSLPLSPHAFPCTSVGSCHGLHLPSVDVMWDTSQHAERISRPPPLSPEDFSILGLQRHPCQELPSSLSPLGTAEWFCTQFPSGLAVWQHFPFPYSSVPCGETVGSGWSQLCLPPHRDHPCSPPILTSKTLQLKPNTSVQRCKNMTAKA